MPVLVFRPKQCHNAPIMFIYLYTFIWFVSLWVKKKGGGGFVLSYIVLVSASCRRDILRSCSPFPSPPDWLEDPEDIQTNTAPNWSAAVTVTLCQLLGMFVLPVPSVYP